MKDTIKNISVIGKTFISLSMLAMSTGSFGDDTELFYTVNVSKPNLLFVLDYSGSMEDNLDGGSSISTSNPSRISVLQSAVKQVLEDAPDNVNIGLMRFGPGFSGTRKYTESYRTHGINGVAFPLTDINAKARSVIETNDDVYGLDINPTSDEQVRSYIPRVVDNWEVVGGTPLVGALYEAALYFRGEKMRYGFDSPSGELGVGAHPSTYEGNIITSTLDDTGDTFRNYNDAPNYESPIVSSCQANYIVLMSDGQPSYYYSGGASEGNNKGPFARNMIGNSSYSRLAGSIGSCVDNPNTFPAGTCGPEITKYIAENDNIPEKTATNLNGLNGKQTIKTYTIGFGANMPVNEQNYLKSLETIEDDQDTDIVEDGYFSATDPASLAAAFTKILKEVAEPEGTLASPGYSVSVKKGLQHENDIYIPVFDRKNTSRWSGNLKKFKLAEVGDDVVIQDKNDKQATDDVGNFNNDIIDIWSTSTISDPDGQVVERGGVASLLNPDNRNIYTNLSGTKNVDLWSSNNALALSNISNLQYDDLGLPDDATKQYRKKIINFMRGWVNGVVGGNNKKRRHMGDMLHSEPLVITYNEGQGVNNTGKLQYIFAGTNEGYLHAFNAETGEEEFAFIPADLLKTISEPQFLNEGTESDHKYGIDGSITGDVVRNKTTGEITSVIVYFGLRRGGTAYYALDVTDIEQPKLLWKKSHSDHASMGQSWSTPYVATVGERDDKQTEVVMISAGYDEDEDRDLVDSRGLVDDSGVEVIADVGNDILIFNAKNGDLVWSLPQADRNKITSSIAGGIRPLDTNNNGLIDRMYFGDTGGNVWRLDLSESIGDSDKKSVLTKLASLGGTGANNRMFFNEPDVSLMRLRGRSVYAVSIGSGFRAHPLDKKINDKFYVLIDDSPFALLKTSGDDKFTAINESDLAKVVITSQGGISQTDNIVDGKVVGDKTIYKRGWEIRLPEKGEKVLSNAIAVNGSIIFPTLVPDVLVNNVDQCLAPPTYARTFIIDILTGTAKWDADPLKAGEQPFSPPIGTSIINVQKIYGRPISDAPVVKDGEPTNKVTCKRPVGIRGGKRSTAITNYDACRMESVYWSDPEIITN